MFVWQRPPVCPQCITRFNSAQHYFRSHFGSHSHEDTERTQQNLESSREPEDPAKLQRAAIHKSSSVARQYPAPRTVWISFWGCASSTFVRKCRTYTSTMFVRPWKLWSHTCSMI